MPSRIGYPSWPTRCTALRNLQTKDILYEVVGALVTGMQYSLVECTSRARRDSLFVSLVIHRPEGVSLDDCTEVYRAVYPRLEVTAGRRDVHLEVSSPGVYRKLKSSHEFGLFEGSTVRVLLAESKGWLRGKIGPAGEDVVTIMTTDGAQCIPFEKISKARLDYP